MKIELTSTIEVEAETKDDALFIIDSVPVNLDEWKVTKVEGLNERQWKAAFIMSEQLYTLIEEMSVNEDDIKSLKEKLSESGSIPQNKIDNIKTKEDYLRLYEDYVKETKDVIKEFFGEENV